MNEAGLKVWAVIENFLGEHQAEHYTVLTEYYVDLVNEMLNNLKPLGGT